MGLINEGNKASNPIKNITISNLSGSIHIFRSSDKKKKIEEKRKRMSKICNFQRSSQKKNNCFILMHSSGKLTILNRKQIDLYLDKCINEISNSLIIL